MSTNTLKLGVVGPCSAGKSTLVARLQKRGFQASHIAQEHSFVPDMWRRISNPDILIYLDVSHKRALARRQQDSTRLDHSKQQERLRHARANAHLYIDTDPLTRSEVEQKVLAYLKKLRL